MKEKLSTIATIAGIVLFVYLFWIRPDYNWADKIIENRTTDGWELITKSESGDLIKPWTWFKTPITGLWFAKKGDIARFDSMTMVGHIFSTNYYDDKTEGSEYYEVFNCLDYKSVIFNNLSDLKTFDPNKTDWYKISKGSPGGDLLEYFCSKNKKYTMLDVFGQEVDISNYIISGMYSLLDSSKYIFEILNNNPYIPTQQDEEMIRTAIKDWLDENYPAQICNLPENIYTISSYKSSVMGYGIPDDVYTCEISPNEKIGKILIRFDFTRQVVPTQYFSKDEVRILNTKEDEE